MLNQLTILWPPLRLAEIVKKHRQGCSPWESGTVQEPCFRLFYFGATVISDMTVFVDRIGRVGGRQTKKPRLDNQTGHFSTNGGERLISPVSVTYDSRGAELGQQINGIVCLHIRQFIHDTLCG